ncbi:unnamed protein product [Rhizopus stolonifer]
MDYKKAFKDYVTKCFNDETTVMLKSALGIVETEIVQNSPRLIDFENFKADWKSRLSYAYNLVPKQGLKPELNLDLSEDTWCD